MTNLDDISIQDAIRKIESTGPLPKQIEKYLKARKKAVLDTARFVEKATTRKLAFVEQSLTALNRLHRANEVSDYDYRSQFRRLCLNGGKLVHQINTSRRNRGV